MLPGKYRLKPWEESVGPLNNLEVKEGVLLAKIGKISLILPLEMEARMRDHIGKRVSLLCTDIPEKSLLFRVLEERSGDGDE